MDISVAFLLYSLFERHSVTAAETASAVIFRLLNIRKKDFNAQTSITIRY
jgi:hypothetical protein